MLWQLSWMNPGDVAGPSQYAVVRHRLEVRDAASVEKFGGVLAVPHRPEVEGPDKPLSHNDKKLFEVYI